MSNEEIEEYIIYLKRIMKNNNDKLNLNNDMITTLSIENKELLEISLNIQAKIIDLKLKIK